MHTTIPANACWSLAEFGEGNRHRTLHLPMRDSIVGRSTDADISIPSGAVSKRHALLSFAEQQLFVEDLGSTNGTFLNGEPIRCRSQVNEGDILQFANALYRVTRFRPAELDCTIEEGSLAAAQALLQFDRLMRERNVQPHFQPIVSMDRSSTPGFELLARSRVEGLTNPAAMFAAAERLGQPAALSELMREEGLRVATASLLPASNYFLNTHPCEVLNTRFTESLVMLRDKFPASQITIEIHEAAIADPSSIGRLRSLLSELDMDLAYDDFGAGQGRLLELCEVPPDVLKFDMALIRDIDQASAKRQDMIAALVAMAIDLGCTALAEGVETEAEHAVCRQLGFQLGQGFLYGRPAAVPCESTVG